MSNESKSKANTIQDRQTALIKQAAGEGPRPWDQDNNRPKVRVLNFGGARTGLDPNDPIGRLLPQHAQYLVDRGVTDEVARERKYSSAWTRAQLRDLGFPDRQQLAPALVIPLSSAQGQRSTYQIRADVPRTVDGKIAKFELPSGSSAVIDVPVRMNRGTTPRIKGSGPFVFTEGVPKADAAASIDLCCTALIGVWGFIVGTADGSTAISIDLREFALKGNIVYLAFDSDQMRKRQVYDALKTFKQILESYGAKVRIIYLPDRPDGSKSGLDDFIRDQQIAGKTDGEIRRQLLEVLASEELKAPPLAPGEIDDQRPVVWVSPDTVQRQIFETENALVEQAAALGIFEYGSFVERVVTLDRTVTEEGLTIPQGQTQFVKVTPKVLTYALNGVVRFMTETRNGPAPIDPPPKVVETYLELIGSRRLPVCNGIITTPIVLPDGRLITQPGYDAPSRLFFADNGDKWPAIPNEPTLDDAVAAIKILKRPFLKFPFSSPASFAAHIATIISTIECRVMPSVPAVGFRSPVMRTGKSKLAETGGVIATGAPPAGQAISSAQDELRKEILAILIQGVSPVNFDDLPDGHVFRSQHLSRVITQSSYGGRLLGVSENIVLPTRIQFTATGNNLSFAGAMRVRTLMVSLDAGVEDPGLRVFDEDPTAFILANRMQLVVAALTPVLAYIRAGSPDQKLPRWGGFEAWDKLIRSALVWAGETDPAETREEIAEVDVDRSADEALYQAWFDKFGDDEKLAWEVVKEAERSANESLLNAILGVARDRTDSRRINSDYFGTRLRGLRGRIIGGLRLVAATDANGKPRKSGGSVVWRIERCPAPGTTTAITIETPASEPPAYTNGAISDATPTTPTIEPTPPDPASPVADEPDALTNTLSQFVNNIIRASRAR